MAEEDFVDYKIFIEAIQAVEALRKLSIEATTFKERLDLATTSVREFNEKTGYGLRNTANAFKAIDQGIANSTKTSTVFGTEFEAGWNRAGRAAESNTRNILGHFNAMRVAIGVITASLVSNLLQAFTQVFTEASKQARQLEETLYRLGNTERILSLEGVEISLAGLEEGITRIQKLLPIFSREDISQLVGTVATSTKQLGFTQEEVLQLSQTIALLNIQSEKSEDLATTRSHVISALLAGNSRGIAELGVTFNEAAMKEKALELGIIKAGDSLKGLSDDTKAQIKLALLHEVANLDDAESIKRLNEFLETNTAKIQSNSAAWKDLLTTIGQGINNLIPDLTGFIEKTQKTFEVANVQKLLKQAAGDKLNPTDVFGFMGSDEGLVDINRKLETGAKLTREEYEKLKEVLSTLSDKDILKIFPDPSAIKDRFTRELIQSLVDVQDTATTTKQKLEEINQVDFSELQNKIEDIITDTENALEDLETNTDRKRSDLDLEYQRRGADAWTDYQRKVEDINRESVDKVAEIKQKHREDDQKREEEYQNKLWELQQKYLMDLEDALHNRDARQIIRLQKQYELEKATMERKNELDAKQSKRDEKADIQKAERDRKDKLAEAAIDYQRKQQDLAIAKQRELDDLNTWHDRELQDIQTAQQRKLETLINGWIEEGKITEANAAQVYSILSGYFGPGGLTDQLYAYMMSSLLAHTAGIPGLLGSVLPAGMPMGYSQLAATNPYSPAPTGMLGNRTPSTTTSRGSTPAPRPYEARANALGFAEGGSFLATTPTNINVGEAGPEIVTATPLGRTGVDINKLFMQAGGGSSESGMGQMEIAVTLSPDLEARVVRKSLNEAANVIFKVNRSKV